MSLHLRGSRGGAARLENTQGKGEDSSLARTQQGSQFGSRQVHM